MTADVLLQVSDLVKEFTTRGRSGFARSGTPRRAVDGVSFEIREGEVLGLVGESGCGKTTTARMIMQLIRPTSGQIAYRGRDICSAGRGLPGSLRREVQMIFQDPYSSLNPRMTVGAIIGEPIREHGLASGRPARVRAVTELMDLVGLNPEHYNRFPHQFSGGQRQRVAIARALALKPKLIVADEPVSALDVSIQAQILNLLRGLQRDFGLAILLIAHDLSVVRYMCDQIAVMYLGRIVELASASILYQHPRHPYSRALLAAVPLPDPHATSEWGAEVMAREPTVIPEAAGGGCNFRPRCPRAVEACGVTPPLAAFSDRSAVACHFPVTSR